MPENAAPPDALGDWLRRIEFRAEVFFRSEYCGRWAVDTSGANHVPFHLVSQGEGWLHGQDSPPRRLLPGNLVFFPHDETHILAATAKLPLPGAVNQPPTSSQAGPVTRLVCGYFRLDRPLAAPLLAGLPPMVLMNLADAPSSSARELVHLLMREAAENQPGGDVAVDRLAELVFIEALRTTAAAGESDSVFGALRDPRLAPVLAAIHRWPEQPHGLAGMAAASSLSESAFAQRFKKAIGMTPGQYVRHWRMQTAARALRLTRRSMAEVSVNVGYSSEVAFRKAFRAHFGQSPGAYRRLCDSMSER
ncbi:MAG: AraC family transcriptional regulator [Pseudomonadota bacterium]